jgi:hypothetical protein
MGLAGSAWADSIDVSFTRVEPHNAALNPASQFTCTASDVAGHPDEVNFHFTNSAAIYCSIMEVYFDDGPMLGIASLGQQGCSFAGGSANPSNLPGGSNLTPPFVATQSFSADAGSGGPTQGIDTSTDFLDMTFTLINGNTFASIVDALNDGALRIGLHVISIGNGASDSFVNGGPGPTVPLPPAALTGLLGMGGVAGFGLLRRRIGRTSV